MQRWPDVQNNIHPSVVMGANCLVGCYTVIEENVRLGDNVSIGNNVTVYSGTVIGDGVTVQDNCVIGKQPKPAKTSTVKIDSPLPPLVVGDNTTIGTGSVIYAGTSIGANCLVADLASVREKCAVGDYVIIGRGVAVENSVSIGSYTKIQTGAYITAYTELEEHVFIAPMVTTTNDNFMGRTEERFKSIKGPVIRRGARIGGGAIILPGIVIAEETFVAAGSLVTKNTEPKEAVKGLPAKHFRSVPDHELLDGK